MATNAHRSKHTRNSLRPVDKHFSLSPIDIFHGVTGLETHTTGQFSSPQQYIKHQGRPVTTQGTIPIAPIYQTQKCSSGMQGLSPGAHLETNARLSNIAIGGREATKRKQSKPRHSLPKTLVTLNPKLSGLVTAPLQRLVSPARQKKKEKKRKI